MAMRVLKPHANVRNDNSAVEVSFYILLLANEENTHTHAFRERTTKGTFCVCVCMCVCARARARACAETSKSL